MIKIFLLTKNETLMLEDWIKYHGCIFGYENLYILDGSDSQAIFDIYERYTSLGLNVTHDYSDLNKMAKSLTEYIHDNKGKGEFLIKLDTDEFLAVADFPMGLLFGRICRWTRLYDLTSGNIPIYNSGIPGLLENLPLNGKIYKAAFTAWSIPLRLTPERPCTDITGFTPIQSTMFKSFFHSNSFKSIDLGGHWGSTTSNNGTMLTPLCILHYHSISLEDSARRARQVLESHGYINEDDDVSATIEKLKLIVNSRHLPSIHKVDMYLQSIQENELYDLQAVNKHHPYYKATRRKRTITLVKDTLENIDSRKSARLPRSKMELDASR